MHLLIPEIFQKILYCDVWTMQGCLVVVQQKNHLHRQRTQMHVWSSPSFTEAGALNIRDEYYGQMSRSLT